MADIGGGGGGGRRSCGGRRTESVVRRTALHGLPMGGATYGRRAGSVWPQRRDKTHSDGGLQSLHVARPFFSSYLYASDWQTRVQ